MSKATITGTATGGILEDDINPVTGKLTVTDADAGESFANPRSNVSSKYGTWSIDKDGNWNYLVDNNNNTVQALPAGATLTDTFTVQSQDLGTSKTVTITITGVNDTATFGPNGTTGTVTEDGTLTATGTVT